MKRLRKKFDGLDPVMDDDGSWTYPIRFYQCGEYGPATFRPHYHACLFNFDFFDKVYWKTVKKNHLYVSESLQKLWPFGYSTVGALTFESAAYVARYCLKKINGEKAEEHYRRFDPLTGEVYYLQPEYSTQSRNPGIARRWFDIYADDIYPSDFLVLDGRKMNPPPYYDSLYEVIDPDDFKRIKTLRSHGSRKWLDHEQRKRLNVKATCLEAKLNNNPRYVE
jgi:hypothetical protein